MRLLLVSGSVIPKPEMLQKILGARLPLLCGHHLGARLLTTRRFVGHDEIGPEILEMCHSPFRIHFFV